MNRPERSEYADFYAPYVARVEGENGIEILKKAYQENLKLLEGISEEKSNFRYAEGKWSIKELVLHLTDSERVFAYRALRFGRGDQTELPGFDQDPYVENCNADKRTFASIVHEYKLVRESSIVLFEGFNEEDGLRKGRANESETSVRSLAFIIAGHEKHHIDVIKERYL